MSASSRAKLAQAPYLWVVNRIRALAFLVAAAVIVGPLLWLEYRGGWMLMQELRVRNETDLTDDWLRVPIKVAAAGAMQADVVLLLGGSTGRELTPSDAYMSASLTGLCGRPIRFVNASSSSQLFGEAWAVTEALPPEKLRLVVVSLNPLRFEEGPADVARSALVQRLPYHMPKGVHELVSRHGYAASRPFPELPVSAWLKRYRSRLERAPAADLEAFVGSDAMPPFQAASHVYAPPALPAKAKMNIVAQMALERVPVYEKNHAQGAALWTEFARHFATTQRQVLFLQLPESRFLEPLTARIQGRYEADLAALRRAGFPVEATRSAELLEEDDFFDQQHLLASGREKIAAALVAQFAARLPGCGGAAG